MRLAGQILIPGLAVRLAHPGLMLRPLDLEHNRPTNTSRHPPDEQSPLVPSATLRRNRGLPPEPQVVMSPWLQTRHPTQASPEMTGHDHQAMSLVIQLLHRPREEQRMEACARRIWNEPEASMPALVVRRHSFQVPGWGAPQVCAIPLEAPRLVPRERTRPARLPPRQVVVGIGVPALI